MIKELKFMFKKQAGVEQFDVIQTFYACKQEEGKPFGLYVLKMKGYVEQLEHLGYVLLQDISVGLILKGLTSDFTGFVGNYNVYNMGKTVGELHALLIEYEKGLPKKDATPQVMAIQGRRIQKANKKSQIAKVKDKGNNKGKDKSYISKPKNPTPSAKEHPTKDNAWYHCKEVGKCKRNCRAYLAKLIKKKKQVGTVKNRVLEDNKRANHNFDSTYLWHCHLAHISKKCIEKLEHNEILKSTDEESCDKCVSCLSGKMTRKPFPHRTERAADLLGIIHTDVCGPLRHVSRQDYLKACRIVQQVTPPYTPQHNGVSERRNRTLLDMVDKTPYGLWYGKVSNLSYLKVWGYEALVKRDTPDKLQQISRKKLLSQEISRRAKELEEIQDEDTSPSENTSKIPMVVKGFEPPQEEVVPICRKVCKLQRSIYGLKQASRSWNKRFNEEIKRFGFTQNLDEPCVYQKASGSNVTFLILYVDDIIIMENHIPSLQSVKSYLGKCFAMKDVGEAAFILGIKIYQDRSKRLIGLSQSAYMDKILKRYRMDNSKCDNIPMPEKLDSNKTQGVSTPKEVKRMQNVPYASAVGSIICEVRCTRPDVAFVQNITNMFLVYGGNLEAELRVDFYYDVGFETGRDDTKSQTGYVFVLNGDAVDWKSSKQSTTAMSAIEAEYIAASEVGMEAVWIRQFISRFGIVPIINEPIKMFCDNSAALYFAYEPWVQKGVRHYHRRYHYIHECIELAK
nr:retrotransposon protein, putative, Ty1-copia subclass [Tanacetum cinerariifolium]